MKIAISAVFLLTYVLIASRRLKLLPIGRTGGALLGALLMVLIGALSPEESYRAIDHDTILLLFAMMLISVYLDEAGFFVRIASWLVSRTRTPWKLLVGISLLAGVCSAFLLNDTVCVFFTPLVVTTCVRAKLPLGPYLIALATSANIGSSATLVGNPQNMIIGGMSKLGFIQFSTYAALPAAIGLTVNLVLLSVFYRRTLPREIEWSPELSHTAGRVPTAFITALEADRRSPIIVLVLLGVVLGFLLGFHLAYTALAGVLALIIFEREDPRPEFGRVDWPLLVFFACLFIVIAGFSKTGFVEDVWRRAAPAMALGTPRGLALFTLLTAAGSNLVSNVPLVLLVGPHLSGISTGPVGWVVLAFASTVAGNLTLVGSVANIIVAEGAREHYTLGFREYLRFGVVSTLAVLAAGVPVAALVTLWLQ